MQDKTIDQRTGLTVEVNTGFEITGNLEHRVEHLQKINTSYTRLLGAALSNPSDFVACLSLAFAEAALKAALRTARMDEDEFKEEIEKVITEVREAISRQLHEQEPHGFSLN